MINFIFLSVKRKGSPPPPSPNSLFTLESTQSRAQKTKGCFHIFLIYDFLISFGWLLFSFLWAQHTRRIFWLKGADQSHRLYISKGTREKIYFTTMDFFRHNLSQKKILVCSFCSGRLTRCNAKCLIWPDFSAITPKTPFTVIEEESNAPCNKIKCHLLRLGIQPEVIISMHFSLNVFLEVQSKTNTIQTYLQYVIYSNITKYCQSIFHSFMFSSLCNLQLSYQFWSASARRTPISGFQRSPTEGVSFRSEVDQSHWFCMPRGTREEIYFTKVEFLDIISPANSLVCSFVWDRPTRLYYRGRCFERTTLWVSYKFIILR